MITRTAEREREREKDAPKENHIFEKMDDDKTKAPRFRRVTEILGMFASKIRSAEMININMTCNVRINSEDIMLANEF